MAQKGNGGEGRRGKSDGWWVRVCEKTSEGDCRGVRVVSFYLHACKQRWAGIKRGLQWRCSIGIEIMTGGVADRCASFGVSFHNL